MISRIVRQNAGSLNPGRKFIMGFKNRPTLKSRETRDECPAPNQLRNSGRVGAMDTLSDNLEIKTPEALWDEVIFKRLPLRFENHVTLGLTQ